MYKVPGVIEIVSRSRVPIPVQQQEIDTIRQIISGASSVMSHEGMIAGEEVIVVKGPLRGIKGAYVGSDGGSQMIVSFPLLRRAVNIKIDPDCIEKLNDGVLTTSQSV
jgi:transcription antitermination factor NusG